MTVYLRLLNEHGWGLRDDNYTILPQTFRMFKLLPRAVRSWLQEVGHLHNPPLETDGVQLRTDWMPSQLDLGPETIVEHT